MNWSVNSGCGCTPAPTYNCQEICSALKVQNSWNIPACDQTALLDVLNLKIIQVGAYIWNPTYGYFLVTSFNSVTGQLTVRNECTDGNAAPGAIVPPLTVFSFSPTALDRIVNWAGVATGTADITNLTLTSAPSAYYDGLWVEYRSVATDNLTTSPTVNINGLGPTVVVYLDGTGLDAHALRANSITRLVYFSGEWFLTSDESPKWTDYSASAVVGNLLSPVVVKYAWRYRRGGEIEIDAIVTGSSAGSNTSVQISTPITIANSQPVIATHLTDNSLPTAGVTVLGNTSRIDVYKYNGSTYTAGAVLVGVRGYISI